MNRDADKLKIICGNLRRRLAAVVVNFAALVFLLLAGHSLQAVSAPASIVGLRPSSSRLGIARTSSALLSLAASVYSHFCSVFCPKRGA